MRKYLLTLLCSFALTAPALGAIATHEFDTQAERDRFRKLTEELRCPKCQNQNIADSNAPISLDLRAETYRLMTEDGLSDEQIVDFLVDRYGDFVRYKPPVDSRTLVLWYGPFALLGLGLLILAGILLRRRVSGGAEDAENRLSGDEQARLNELLNQTRDTSDQ